MYNWFNWSDIKWWRKTAPPRTITINTKPMDDIAKAQEWVDKAQCPKCQSSLTAGPCGGAAQNVVCGNSKCEWRVNTLPMGGRYHVINLIDELPLEVLKN